MTLAKTATDTVYIYGQIVAGGYGAVVTERYAYLKGMLLITVRKTYGKENGHVVTETNRYASHSDFLNDNPQQTNVTELFGRQKDTIVTYVLRNGRLETYTFRLPVITKVVSPQDGSVRVTTRYASGGAIVSKIDDGSGNLIQLRRSFGQADGSTVTRTEYPDYSWKQVRTIGQADGTIIRESTSGFSSFGSGFNTPIGRPPILNCRPETTHRSLASGVGTIKPPKIPFPLPPPPQCMISENVGKTCLKHEPCTRFLASGCGNRPPVLPPASAS